MYERPILREQTAPFVELVPLTGYSRARAPARSALPGRKRGLLRRSATFLAIALPAAIGVATGHWVLGAIASALALMLAGLIAFGLSTLDGTIELY